MDGERAKKKKRKKRKKKLRDVQCLNHSDRRVIAPAKEEINRDLIARIFGFTAIPRVTRFKRFSIVRLSRCLTGTDTVYLSPALFRYQIQRVAKRFERNTTGSLIFLMSSDAVGEINFASFRARLKFGRENKRWRAVNGGGEKKGGRSVKSRVFEHVTIKADGIG